MILAALSALLPAASAETAASPPSLDALLDGLKATYSETESIQADFTQVTRSSFGESPPQTGRITLGRPRMMRVEFTNEGGSLFLSDGEDLYVYTPASNQVIITPDLAEKSDGVSDLLSSLSALEESFEVSLTAADDAAIALSLTPRDGDARFKEMALTLTPDYRLTRLQVTDAFDATTEMTFTNLQLDPTLPEGIFQLDIPAGAQVIRADQI